MVKNNAMLITIAVCVHYKSGFCGRLRHIYMVVSSLSYSYKMSCLYEQKECMNKM